MNLAQNIEGTISRFLELQKAGGISASTGLTFYDLEARAKYQYPVLAPIRKTMPRIGTTNPLGGQGLAVHWNAVTSPNAGNVPAEAAEGQSGALLTPTVVPRVATYKLLALDSNVTWFAEWAGYGYEDVRSSAQRMALDAMILQEEPRILWGNSGTAGVGLQFGQANTPTVVGVTSITGGSLNSATGSGNYYVAVAALSYQGLQLTNAPTAYNGGGGSAVVPQYVKVNGDGTTLTMNGGVSQISALSAAANIASGATGSFTMKTVAIPGAASYIWYLGNANSAGSVFFSQITATNVATFKVLPTTGQAANYTGSGTDYSYNPLAFDGLITQAVAGNGYFNSLDGAVLTSDNAGGCNEINTVFKYMWDNFKISPTHIWAGSGSINSITKVILSSGTSSSLEWRVGVSNTPGDVGNLTGAAYIGSVNNRFALGARKPVPIDIHPNIPDGHIFFDLEINPYPSANIPYARAIRTLRDYFQVIWPATPPNWRNSIFAAEVLQLYTPYGMALLSNIGNS